MMANMVSHLLVVAGSQVEESITLGGAIAHADAVVVLHDLPDLLADQLLCKEEDGVVIVVVVVVVVDLVFCLGCFVCTFTFIH